jgi:hypothetical protein
MGPTTRRLTLKEIKDDTTVACIWCLNRHQQPNYQTCSRGCERNARQYWPSLFPSDTREDQRI